MDLKIFFDPLDQALFTPLTGMGTVYQYIKINFGDLPLWKKADIAIIGLPEERGTITNTGTAKGPDVVRKNFYNLKKGVGKYKIVDLGNLRPGITLEETNLRIQEVCNILIKKDVMPILIGGSHDLDYGQFLAYQDMDKLISVLNIDCAFDIDEKTDHNDESSTHIQKLLVHQPNFLFNYSHLGYQTYLNAAEEIEILEKLYFQAFRLGHIRDQLKEMEPVIREADMLSFDVSAIKFSDAPGNKNAKPFGLTAEEACQICWYAGINEKLSSAGFYEYNPEVDVREMTAGVIGTMIWYFIEGFYSRKGEKDFRSNDYLRYVVTMPNEPSELIFFKSKLSEKWWMEVSLHVKAKEEARNFLIPCSYEDYALANKGELPERWINTKAKLIE